MASSALQTYLNDHLAGSSAALQLLEHLKESAATPVDTQFFQTLAVEIGEDREILRKLIEAAGGDGSLLRQAGGWLAAKVGQLKLTFDNPDQGALGRFEALEALSLGILGKSALWRALRTLKPAPAEMRAVELDLEDLERRALDQHQRVEALRLQAAQRALGDGS